MKPDCATALVCGDTPLAQMAETAVRQALERCDPAAAHQAQGVLLLLSSDFDQAHLSGAAVQAAARAARCTQIVGGCFSGICTEAGWVLDRPAAAALVFVGDQLGLGLGSGMGIGTGMSTGAGDAPPGATSAFENNGQHPLLSLAAGAFPPGWRDARPRFGLIHGGCGADRQGSVWQQGRQTAGQQAEARLLGVKIDIGISRGLRRLGEPMTITGCDGYDLYALEQRPATAILQRLLPEPWRHQVRDGAPWPLHLLAAFIEPAAGGAAGGTLPGDEPVALIASTAHHLTLAMPLQAGQRLCWAIRHPLGSESDMHQTLNQLGSQPPAFALMASCIGRGPYFYGGEDRDHQALTTHWPNTPLLGAYGAGQIAPFAEGNRLLQNSVVVARADLEPG